MKQCVAVLLLALTVSSSAAQDSLNKSQPSARLTWAAPVARLALGPAPNEGAVIAVYIGIVHNPAREPVSIQLSLSEPDAATQPTPITTISLFPSDRPGRFFTRPPRASAPDATRMKPVLIATLVKGPGQPRSPQLAIDDIKAEWIAAPK